MGRRIRSGDEPEIMQRTLIPRPSPSRPGKLDPDTARYGTVGASRPGARFRLTQTWPGPAQQPAGLKARDSARWSRSESEH
eukprot:758176-Hanusia_phi.AAC.2